MFKIIEFFIIVLRVYFSFCRFSFGHWVVCFSSTYGFWLPHWYLQSLLSLGNMWGLSFYSHVESSYITASFQLERGPCTNTGKKIRCLFLHTVEWLLLKRQVRTAAWLQHTAGKLHFYDSVHVALDQHAYFDLNRDHSLKQQSAVRHVTR